MRKLRIISLGAWCRPAHQIGAYAQKNREVEGLKGPFDWTITSFEALKTCLQPDFDVGRVLEPGRIVTSFAGSGMCEQSGVIFHHAIAPETLVKFGAFTRGDKIPQIDGLDAIVNVAKDKFLHTFGALESLRADQEPILFVRWQRQGHPDPRFPAAFEGETEAEMIETLKTYLGHDHFHVLSVQSKTVKGQLDPFSDPIIAFQANGKSLSCSIRERLGWNGSQDNNFKGDESSWGSAFDQVFSHLRQTENISNHPS